MVKKQQNVGRPFLRWLFLVVILAAVAFGSRTWQIYQINADIEAAETAKKALLAQNRDLTMEASSLTKDDRIIALARENLNMIFPGEKHYLSSQVQEDVLPFQPIEGDILD